MKESKKRTLYECFNARVLGEAIRCSMGHPFSTLPGNGHIDIDRLIRGKRLAFKVCQGCPDFDWMGPPVPPNERGWIDKEETK